MRGKERESRRQLRFRIRSVLRISGKGMWSRNWPKLHLYPVSTTLVTHTILKVQFLSKNSILTKPQHFHEFFIQTFLTIFLVKSKLSTAKKSKITTFSPKKIDNFLGKSKLNFWTKNEDFEQCVETTNILKSWRFWFLKVQNIFW